MTIASPDQAELYLARITDSHRRLLDDLDLEPLDPAAPTRLPGWTVGHLLTHLARNADGTARMAVAAAIGVTTEKYVGGAAGREAEIELGAGRDWAALLADVEVSAVACDVTLSALPDEVWAGEVSTPHETYPAMRLLMSRWREVEVHRLDLGGDHHSGQWPGDFARTFLPDELALLPTRAPGVAVPDGIADHEVLAWLLGRGGPDLPELPAWG
ncbi:maleylpyruvate isomerase family mycothiol-dependent enzyme [Luteimicrobium xylanilyticum]|uniref:Maleylpyruvate isomerase n=1 Tax=Luteimicrobium xylanilyticum TaxID=1133546 RepID=A0A5P9QDZ4_9MICO|nr:maleylpyruvate isomerase N-terminal domain-containing protein [Luteimicrobium xylanilyticum]QFU99684.1 Maleylpyruvate isomerase [Luteimicrobium xylanilyticum]